MNKINQYEKIEQTSSFRIYPNAHEVQINNVDFVFDIVKIGDIKMAVPKWQNCDLIEMSHNVISELAMYCWENGCDVIVCNLHSELNLKQYKYIVLSNDFVCIELSWNGLKKINLMKKTKKLIEILRLHENPNYCLT